MLIWKLFLKVLFWELFFKSILLIKHNMEKIIFYKRRRLKRAARLPTFKSPLTKFPLNFSRAMNSGSASSRKVVILIDSCSYFCMIIRVIWSKLLMIDLFFSWTEIWGKALSKIACNRLQKELVQWQVNPLAGFNHKVTDNLQRFWTYFVKF